MTHAQLTRIQYAVMNYARELTTQVEDVDEVLTARRHLSHAIGKLNSAADYIAAARLALEAAQEEMGDAE